MSDCLELHHLRRWVLLENVANLLSDRMRSLMDYIMQEIADGLRVSSIEASPALFIFGFDFHLVDFKGVLEARMDLALDLRHW